MAVNQKNFLHDPPLGELEIINDDRFIRSLFDIVFTENIQSHIDLAEHLDASGYIGRYDIKQLRKYGRRTDNIKIQIYLPDSAIHYNWPLKTFLTIGDYKNLLNIQRNLPPNSFDLIKSLYQYNTKYKDMLLRFTSSKHGKKYQKLLADYPLLNNNIPIIKSKIDAEEIASNIVKI